MYDAFQKLILFGGDDTTFSRKNERNHMVYFFGRDESDARTISIAY
jgi:hypothetical protein